MKTRNQIRSVKKNMVECLQVSFSGRNHSATKWTGIFPVMVLFLLMILLPCCSKSDDSTGNGNENNTQYEYNVEQAISDEAQLNTIAFDGLAFMTGNVGSQSFLPPGKVADYSGFQHLRDNDPTKLGHNTGFVTIIAFNVLHILNNDQIAMLIEEAEAQVDQINEFARYRYPLLKAFRRLIEDDLPAGKTRLSKEAVLTYTAGLYNLDGQISYGRARVFGNLVNSMNSLQKEQLTALKNLNGIGHWDSALNNPLQGYNMPQDVNIAVMTYASEFYAWYAGSVTGDVYFCPERHGTYFGSFYLKDWPAMGNPNYTIDETLTATAGKNFLNLLSLSQLQKINGIVMQQKSALNEIVLRRTDISTELRKFLSSGVADSSLVITLSERYGELDGELSYYYVTAFAEVFQSLTEVQKNQLLALADQLGYIDPAGAFLYLEPVPMPVIANTDDFFE